MVFISQPTGLLWLLFCLVLRKYSALFQIFATFCRAHSPDEVATDHLPPWYLPPRTNWGSSNKNFSGVFSSEYSDSHVGKANTLQFSGPEQPFRCLDDKQLRMFCLDSLPTKGNDLSWWYTCPQAILPIAPNCVYLASGLWCLVSVIIWLGLLFRATSLHNDLINKANGTSVLTMVAQWLQRVKIIFHFAFCSSCSCSTLRLVPGKFVLITSFARLVSCNSGILEKQPFKKMIFF